MAYGVFASIEAVRLPPGTVTIDAITNARHENGQLVSSWTARKRNGVYTVTNDLTGAVVSLGQDATDALAVLRGTETEQAAS